MIDKNNNLFVLNPKATQSDAKDGISERISKIQAITNYILADAANGEPSVSNECLLGAIWMVESLVHEIDTLQAIL